MSTNFKFDKNSGTVKIWVTLILDKIYELEDVPELFNLKEAVTEVFNEMTGKIKKVEPKAEEKKEAAEEPVDLMAGQDQPASDLMPATEKQPANDLMATEPTAADMMTGAPQQ